jgi:hypothetical protein
LLSKKYGAYRIIDIVIRKFYDFAGFEMPEWLTRWMIETALDELDVDEAAIIRSILFDHIHDKLRTNAYLLAMKNDGAIHIETRIAACLDNNLLSFIKKAKSDNGIDVYHIVEKPVTSQKTIVSCLGGFSPDTVSKFRLSRI